MSENQLEKKNGSCRDCGSELLADETNKKKVNRCPACQEDHRLYMKQRRDKAREDGICICCLSRPREVESRSQCSVCIERTKNWQTRRREQAAATGMCKVCFKEPVKPRRRYCEKCLELYNSRNKVVYTAKLEAGICARCGVKNSVPGRTQCIECLKALVDYVENRRKKLSEEGICIDCASNPRHGKLLRCQSCAEKNARNTRERNLIRKAG